MRDFIIESDFNYKGIRCIVLALKMGHRCGYCEVKKEHPLYKKDYMEDIPKLAHKLKELKKESIGKRGIVPLFCWDGKEITPEILLDVHGGITFSSDGKDGYPIKSKGWWFGFDCAHYNDGRDFSIMDEKNKKAYSNWPKFGTEIVRDNTYVKNECKRLVEQLIILKSEVK